jgi:bifunctional non-homologous end joining protein LigD
MPRLQPVQPRTLTENAIRLPLDFRSVWISELIGRRASANRIKASFIEPMLLMPSTELPEGAAWLYELKLDGYRAVGIRSGGEAQLRSRNGHHFNKHYPSVAKALAALPDETVVDGEVVAVDEAGRPSFNLLQNDGAAGAPVFYYLFDLLVLDGSDVTSEPLSARRKLLEDKVLPLLTDPIRYSPELPAALVDLIQSVKAQGLEGLVAKRRDSLYEPGQRSGAWRKMRVDRGQEFVIGGFTVAGAKFDAVIFGYYGDGGLIYAARTRSGFTPAVRAQLLKHFREIETTECPFVNLPESRSGRWGDGLTAEKMRSCRWVKPTLVGQFEFVEWTADDHLRHSRFVGLREDRKPEDIRREG